MNVVCDLLTSKELPLQISYLKLKFSVEESIIVCLKRLFKHSLYDSFQKFYYFEIVSSDSDNIIRNLSVYDSHFKYNNNSSIPKKKQ